MAENFFVHRVYTINRCPYAHEMGCVWGKCRDIHERVDFVVGKIIVDILKIFSYNILQHQTKQGRKK